MATHRERNLAILKGHAEDNGWTVLQDNHQVFVCEYDGRELAVYWSSRGTPAPWWLTIGGVDGTQSYEGKDRLGRAVALMENKGRRYHLLKIDWEHWLILDHMDPNWQGRSIAGLDAQQRAETELRKLNHEGAAKAQAAILFSYTEVHHTVVVSAPADAPPMDMDGDWQIQPGQATLHYTIRTQSHADQGWQRRAEVTGPWIQRKDKPERVGSGNLLPWDEKQHPAWLTEAIQAHWPQWTPDLPKAVITTPKRKEQQA